MRGLRVVDTDTSDGGRRRELIPIARVRSPAPGSRDSIEIEAITPKQPKRRLRKDKKIKRSFSSSRRSSGSMREMPPKRSETEKNVTAKTKTSVKTEEASQRAPKVPNLELNTEQNTQVKRNASNVRKVSKRVEKQTPKKQASPMKWQNVQATRRGAPTPRRQEEGQELALGFTDLSEEELRDFDLMNINITIYGMAGILCEEKEAKKAKKRTPLKSKQKGDYPEEYDIPTTVAASMKRNVASSQQEIETFLPSQPIHVYSEPGKSTRLSSVWQTSSKNLLHGSDNERDENGEYEIDSSFQMLRMMMKRPFVKGQSGIVENYVHETIQVGLNLCRGKELLRLGTARLIITGEEEGEVMIHIPVRPMAQMQEKEGKTKKKPKKNDHKTSFENDTRHFSLDENASLYVGVRVHPQQDIEAAAQYKEEVVASDMSDSELLRMAHAAKLTVMEEKAKSLEYQTRTLYKAKTASTTSSAPSLNSKQKQKEQPRPPQQKQKSTDMQTHQRQMPKQTQHIVPQKPAVPQKPSTTMVPGIQSMFSGFLCGAALPLMAESEPVAAEETSTQNSMTSKKSSAVPNDEIRKSESSKSSSTGLPISEILNLKYGPEYAKSFFSGVTFSTGATSSSSSDDMDLSAVVEQTARQLAQM